MAIARKRAPYIAAGLAFGLLLMGANPLNAQGDCKTILTAASKMMTSVTHVYSTISRNGKEHTIEMIFLPGVYYSRTDASNWSSAPMSGEERAEMLNSKTWTNNVACTYVKDESVNGEMAGVYSWHDVATGGDTQIWISKAKGVPLRQDTYGAHQTHFSIRYEYGSVKPPM
jgi:hypothetical protein